MNSARAVKTGFSVTTGNSRDSRKCVSAGCDSTMVVSIRSYEGRVPSGTFISFFSDKKYDFQGLDQMLLIMEDIMDSVSTPWPVFGHRSLYEEEEPYVFCETGCCPQDFMQSVPQLPSGRANLVIRFYYRQHGSMQGELLAAVRRKQKKVAFRSALELMRLLYEYLDTELGRGNQI